MYWTVILRRDRLTAIAVEKQYVLSISSVSLTLVTQHAKSVLGNYYIVTSWPAWPYQIIFLQ